MTTTFTGRTRAETKRKALAYWVDNQESLGLTMREFFDRCSLSADGTMIVFLMPVKAPAPSRLLAAFRTR